VGAFRSHAKTRLNVALVGPADQVPRGQKACYQEASGQERQRPPPEAARVDWTCVCEQGIARPTLVLSGIAIKVTSATQVAETGFRTAPRSHSGA
jgi:hypothetical protein